MRLIIDTLIDKIKLLKNPTCVGLDTSFSYLPENMVKKVKSTTDAAKAVLEFNLKLIDKLAPIIPSVKVQVAYYEALGVAGMQAFYDTLIAAKKAGLVVIADAKRNDIGATAEEYAKAFLSDNAGFPCDFLTVNGYLGSDGILPFVKYCKENNKGIFILAKTSNPASFELQDKQFTTGETLYEAMGDLIEKWGDGLVGEYGYSSIAAVVGATHKAQAAALRARLNKTFFLIPGYGVQGGGVNDIAVSFDKGGEGGIVNNSRGILCAYRQDKYKGLSFEQAAFEAAAEMRESLSVLF